MSICVLKWGAQCSVRRGRAGLNSFKYYRAWAGSRNECSSTKNFQLTTDFKCSHLKSRTYRTDRFPAAAVADAPVHAARIDAQAVSAVTAVRVERTRPIVAVTTRTADITIATITRRRKKYRVSVYFTCYFISVYSIFGCPFPNTIWSIF